MRCRRLSEMGTVYIIPAYNSGIRLGPVFRQVITGAQKICNKVLIVDNSGSKDQGMTRQIAIDNGAEIIQIPKLSAGYARSEGLMHAFGALNADIAVLGDDDGHNPPEGIPLLCAGIFSGADLVLGKRSIKDHLTHPPFQLMLESGFNLLAGILTSSFPADFLSGSAAFSRKGWESFSGNFLANGRIRMVKTGVPFFVPLYKTLGLNVASVTIPAPYEGAYLKDSLDPKFYRKRVGAIRNDSADLINGLRLRLESCGRRRL